MRIPSYSIVILCYQSGEFVKEFVRKTIECLDQSGIYGYEIILIGNYHRGKKDPTPSFIHDLAERDPRIKYSTVPKQGMMGWDMKSGLSMADGDYVAVIDGDGQMPVCDLVNVYNKIISTKADLVTTYREIRGDGLFRKFISYIYNFSFRVLFPGLGCRDINSKPKIFRKASLRKLNLLDDGWFIDGEMMIQARRLKLKIVEIPTEFKRLESNRSSFINIITCFQTTVSMIN